MTLPSSGPLSMNDIAGEFGGSTPHALNEYYAGGGLVPAGTSGTYGAVPSSGTISIQNFYGTSNYVPVYIEEVFSTYLYTANNTTQTITNNINLSANGGLIWFKTRNTGGAGATHTLVDSARGNNGIYSSLTDAQGALSVGGGGAGTITLNTNGFTINGSVYSAQGNINYGTTDTLVSWTFRKQPKFFDVVTWTGNGTSGRSLPHSLGSVPGCVIIKRTSGALDWTVWHRSLSGAYPSSRQYLSLNLTDAAGTASQPFTQAPSSTDLTLSASISANGNGSTYVAYLFAHDAGGFGLTGTDNVISCGSFTTNSSGNATVSLGYEPQWVMVKAYGGASSGSGGAGDWIIQDAMRNFSVSTSGSWLYANTNNAEITSSSILRPTANGFISVQGNLTTDTDYLYIAIRRGPMKTPTTGTSVFTPATRTGTGATVTTTAAGFPVDTYFVRRKSFASFPNDFMDRLRGAPALVTNSAGAESAGNGQVTSWAAMSGVQLGGDGETNSSNPPNDYVDWYFRRAPGFFDVVCYSGNGASSQTIPHNLGVTPELIINRRRANNSGVANPQWLVWRNSTSAGILNNDESFDSSSYPAFITSVGATSYSVNNSVGISSLQANLGADSYVTYLFATCPGVSKVGVYTGTGALQTINCGFTSGARFVLIKRIDSGSGFTGLPWYVWDSARGISSSSDPYLQLNSSAAEVTGTNYVDTTSVGFQVTAAAPTSINGSGGSFLFLAIA